MVVTMLEARVADENTDTLVNEYHKVVDEGLPDEIPETMLLHADDSDMWRIVTIWDSRAVLDEFRATVDVPDGVLIFRAAGAEPSLTIFEVAARASH